MPYERNPRGQSRSFRVARKVRLPIAKRVKRKKSNQGSNSWIPSYIAFIALIGLLIALLGAKDSFKEHPANKWISVAALLILCVSQATREKIVANQNCWEIRFSQIIESFRVLSGALVTVSLLSVFLSVPDRFGWLYVGIWLLGLMVAFLYTWIFRDDVLPAWSAARCFA